MINLFFDTETTGLPKSYDVNSNRDLLGFPRVVQLSWILSDDKGKELSVNNIIVKPDGFEIPQSASNIHGISNKYALKHGIDLKSAIDKFMIDVELADNLVCHNTSFDCSVMGGELYRLKRYKQLQTLLNKDTTCTMKKSTDFMALPSKKEGFFKYPKLQELYCRLFGKEFSNAHNAMADVKATKKCYFELIKQNVI